MPRPDGIFVASHVGRSTKDKYFEEVYDLIFKNVSYNNVSIKTDEFFDSFLSTSSFDYLNVSAPYQTRVMDFLDKTSDIVRETKFCNFVSRKHGVTSGYNTEKYGITSTFRKNGIEVKDKNILVILDGNSANTLMKVLEEENASRVDIASLSSKRAEYPFESDGIDYDLIISTIPTGSKVLERVLIDLSKYKNLKTYIDFAYMPYRTPTMLYAKTLGIGFLGGMTKFISEVALSALIINRSPVPTELWNAVKSDLICRHTNLYLIGLPSDENDRFCNEMRILLESRNGKGTKSYIDTDELIQKYANKRIKTILKTKDGQEFYQRMQKDLSKELSKVEGRIVRVPCALLSEVKNYELIAPKGYFIYLKRTDFNSFSWNKKSSVSSVEELKRMYKKYNAMLEEISDLTTMEDIDCQKLVDEACEALSNT